MRQFRADLHIHTCLSPCADLDMSPRGIVARALEAGLDFIAVCDHNSAENVAASVRAGLTRGLWVLPGMEINCREEVHSLAIFEQPEAALEMQSLIYRHLRGTNRPELFGDQVVVNEEDEVEGFNDRLLIGAAQLGIYEVVREVHRLGGVSIASHVDRPSNSVLGQLGFIPPDLEFDALEVSRHATGKTLEDIARQGMDCPLLRSSDAHFPQDIGNPCTVFEMERATWDEFRLALRRKLGRQVRA